MLFSWIIYEIEGKRMSELINKGEFVELEYTGVLKDSGDVFDTTSKEVAENNDIGSDSMKYGPVIICLGEGQLLEGLDKGLEGKKLGTEVTVELSADEAFGKRDAKLIQLINTGKFKQHNINPMPGLQVNIDGMIGIIKTVTGGRTIVDFNHPLAGRELVYKVKILRKVTDAKEQIKSYVDLAVSADCSVEIAEKKAKITVKKELPANVTKQLCEKLIALITEVENAEFEIKKE